MTLKPIKNPATIIRILKTMTLSCLHNFPKTDNHSNLNQKRKNPELGIQFNQIIE